MLSLFPQILFLAPLSATILRVIAAFSFAYVAYRMLATSKEITHTKLPIIGEPASILVWISALVTGGTALLLFIGLYTQAAAIVGMIVALKHGIAGKRYEHIIPLARGTNILLFFICLSLLFTGAGAFGMDLPL